MCLVDKCFKDVGVDFTIILEIIVYATDIYHPYLTQAKLCGIAI